MRVGQLPITAASAVLFACGGVACGGVEPTGMSIAIARSALAEDVVSARIQVHVKDRSCDDVQNSGPEKRATYTTDVEVSGGGAGNGEIHAIRPGSYTIAVWTFAAGQDPREFGCEPNVEIKSGKMAEVTITLNPL